MNASITRSVTDLVDCDKQSLEHLLGVPLSKDQRVYVTAFTPGGEPDPEMRVQAADAVEKMLDRTAAHAHRRGVTDAQIDQAVDEVMSKVRPRKST